MDLFLDVTLDSRLHYTKLAENVTPTTPGLSLTFLGGVLSFES